MPPSPGSSLLMLPAAALLFVCGLTAPARAGEAKSLAVEETIAVPGKPLTGFDISWVDPKTHQLYLADRSNNSIDIFDTRTLKFVARIGGFVGDVPGGYDHGGPNGVVAIDSPHEVFAGDGDSTVKVIDLDATPPKIAATIPTGGQARADELSYDAADQLAMVANPDEKPPFVSIISTRSNKIVGKIDFADATDGLEQSVWDPRRDLFYQVVPEVKHGDGAIAEIDPKSMKVTRTFPVRECHGAGLTLGPGDRLLIGCTQKESVVMDAMTGKVIAATPRVTGSDEVWYNRGDQRYYLAAVRNPSGPVLGVIDAKTNTWVENLATAYPAHSVAADPSNNRVFVPMGPNQTSFDTNSAKHLDCRQGCIGVYADKP
ncbi:MAG: cytochrome C nitrite reductase [Candidatus Binataceae bacterium]